MVATATTEQHDETVHHNSSRRAFDGSLEPLPEGQGVLPPQVFDGARRREETQILGLQLRRRAAALAGILLAVLVLRETQQTLVHGVTLALVTAAK